MTLAAAIGLILKASLFLIVLEVGLRAGIRDAISVLANPGRLVRAVLAMSVIMPAVAALMTSVFVLHPAVKLALIALALSPVPPFWPANAIKSGGDERYAVGLFVASSVLALFIVPAGLAIAGRQVGTGFDVPRDEIVRIVFVTLLIPLAVGMAIRHVAPGLAARAVRPVSIVVVVLLVVSAVPLLVKAWPLVVKLIGQGTLVAMIVFVLIGLAVGHLLGAAPGDDRTVLALATAARHPGIAMAIAHATYPKQEYASAAIFLYVLVSVIVARPYVKLSSARAARSRPGSQRGPRAAA